MNGIFLTHKCVYMISVLLRSVVTKSVSRKVYILMLNFERGGPRNFRFLTSYSMQDHGHVIFALEERMCQILARN